MYIYYYYLKDVLRIGSEESNLIAMQLCGFVENEGRPAFWDVQEKN